MIKNNREISFMFIHLHKKYRNANFKGFFALFKHNVFDDISTIERMNIHVLCSEDFKSNTSKQ